MLKNLRSDFQTRRSLSTYSHERNSFCKVVVRRRPILKKKKNYYTCENHFVIILLHVQSSIYDTASLQHNFQLQIPSLCRD
ncbi:hypothetical protein RCL_jg27862.t1 [Rhizophagus clarus]|uniref:Uncharacterized protein n=1 Tax=Rhizophagus clarus TaxID=94130 RepID=A0A8H3QXB9_9GLOM|nr:hypothetical protein RCL_jg27862.t1 [Rhizophagus clarus]